MINLRTELLFTRVIDLTERLTYVLRRQAVWPRFVTTAPLIWFRRPCLVSLPISAYLPLPLSQNGSGNKQSFYITWHHNLCKGKWRNIPAVQGATHLRVQEKSIKEYWKFELWRRENISLMNKVHNIGLNVLGTKGSW